MTSLIKHYGFFGVIRLIFDKFLTYFIFKNAKIIRHPFELRGKQNIVIDEGFTTGRYCRIEAYADSPERVIKIGKNCQINDSVHIAGAKSITLGDNVLIASRVFITDLNHGSYAGELHSPPQDNVASRALVTAAVVIQNNVWLGEGVVVLPGVTIGSNSIIGANSVVTKNIPENAIAVGNPAKVVKIYNFDIKKWN